MLINRSAEMHSATSTMERLAIKAASDQSRVSSLSGGNQQKVLIGKWLATGPEVLILDEPTRGVDVGAKEQIHRLIDQLAKSGVAILLISSELGEVLALSDRVLVMRQGRIVGELSRSEATQEAVLALALPTESQLPVTTRHRSFVARETGVAALLLFTILLATVVNPSFASVANVRDLLVRISPAAIVGVAMTLVILCREIDISVGSLMGLCAAALGIAASPDRMALPPVAAAGVCLAVGVLGGLFNGILVAYAKLPSIIVTLGTLTLFKGITELALAGRWVENLPSSLRTLGAGSMFGVPPIILLAILAALAGIWITRRTAFGLRIYAVGSNPAAARLRGIDRRRIQLSVFVLAGIFSGLAALFSATQLQVIESGFGSGFELVVIAAVIVGGTSIRGGRGTIVGTLLGAALLGIVSTVLIFLRLGESAAYWEKAIQGGFILLAVLGDHLRRRAPK
jgi:ribose/xylose/arabinose/galactoside ABC-type transport system permease subunit